MDVEIEKTISEIRCLKNMIENIDTMRKEVSKIVYGNEDTHIDCFMDIKNKLKSVLKNQRDKLCEIRNE